MAAELEVPESQQWEFRPSVFCVLSKGANEGSSFTADTTVFFIYKGAIWINQTGRRMSLLLHTHNSKWAFLSGVGSGWDLVSPSSHLSQTSHPLGGTPQANSTFPIKATSLSHCLSIPIVLPQKRKGREREVKRRKGPVWALTSQVLQELDFEHLGPWIKPMSF